MGWRWIDLMWINVVSLYGKVPFLWNSCLVISCWMHSAMLQHRNGRLKKNIKILWIRENRFRVIWNFLMKPFVITPCVQQKPWKGIHFAGVATLAWWLWNSDYLLPNLTNKNMEKVLHVISEPKWRTTAIF